MPSYCLGLFIVHFHIVLVCLFIYISCIQLSDVMFSLAGGGVVGCMQPISGQYTFTVYFTAGGHKARGGMKLGGRLHWGVGVLAGTGYG